MLFRSPLLTLCILLMVVGVQFVSLGLLGEMMAHVRGGEPEYPVRERLDARGGA